MVPRLFARLALIVPFAALLYVACEHNPAEPGSLASITVTRNPETLPISTTVQFSATGKDANGREVGINPTWSVAAGGGTITSSGVFLAGTAPGTFANTVTATVGSISGTASVTVTAGPVATIAVTPTPVTLATSTNQQFTAVGKDAAGNVVSISPNWSVAAGGGTINGTGLFTSGTVAGTYTNTATASVGGISGTATVTVTAGALALMTVTPNPKDLAIGATQTFTATGKDANGNAVSVTPAWSVVAGGGTIVGGSGVFTAGSTSGSFANTVKATSGTVSGFATVSVSPGVLATITVTPSPVTMATGGAQQFAAVGKDASGNVIPILPTWSRVGAGTVNSAGLYVAGAAGAFADSVRATSGSIFGRAVVNIIAANPLAAIVITPNPGSLLVSDTLTFSASGRDAGGTVVPISPAPTWSVVSSLSAAGTIVGATGKFTAGTVAGTYTNAIQATSGTISGFATVNVNNPPSVGPSLGTAETHGLLAGSAFTCAGAPGTINADASVWPGTAFTGFPPCVITGATHAGDGVAQTAQGDLTTAFLALAAMPCGTTITADLGGTTLAPGVYCSNSSVGVTGPVTLAGPATGLFVIRAASTLTTAGSVVMSGGALAKNVYWWVGSSATLGTGSAWQGNILALTSITLVDNATLCGRALARNGAVSLGTNNTIKLPPAAAATCP